MKTSRKSQPGQDRREAIQNKVHQLIQEIERHFESEGRERRDFATAALAGALRFLEEIAESGEIATATKVRLLSNIYAAANEKIEKLESATATAPVAQWASRGKDQYRMSPCDWVKAHYPSYGNGLSTEDIKDRKLLRALWNYKTRYGWPDDFELLSRSELLDRLVKEEGPDIDLKGLAEAPPNVRRRRSRLWQAQRRRNPK